MKVRRNICLFMTIVVLSSCLGVDLYAEGSTSEKIISIEDLTTSSTAIELAESKQDIKAEFNIVGRWDNGFNGEIVLKNTTNKSIEGWKTEFEFPHEIINIWGANIVSHNDDKYIIKHADYNMNIEPNSGVIFGFTCSLEGEIIPPNGMKLISNVSENDIGDYSVDFVLNSDWGSGYTAQMTITNNTDANIEGWALSFDFDKPIDSIYNGKIDDRKDGRYYISNSGYNSIIYAKSSVTFGFGGNEGNIENEPVNYALTSVNGIEMGTGGNDENDEIKIIIDTEPFGDFKSYGIGYFVADDLTELRGSLINHERVKNLFYKIDRRNGEIVTEGQLEVDRTWNIKEISDFSDGLSINIYAEDSEGICVVNSVSFMGEEDYKDNDEDGLINYLEDTNSCDRDKNDTDGDGLNDFYELMYTDTSPTLVDTDSNGISDGNEDLDGDGLNNIEECILGTSPLMEDTDGDGLTDYNEVNIYFTDPLKYDTDGDGLSDEDEIELGLNPNIIDTDGDGINDNEEKIYQVYSADISCEESPAITKVEVAMNATGNVGSTTQITNMYNINMYSTELVGLIGAPIDITTTSEFDTATVTYTYDKNIVTEDKLENAGVLWYNEAEGTYEDMGAVIDTDKCTITFVTTHFSEYSVCDMKEYNEAISNPPDYSINDGNAEWNGVVAEPNQIPGFDASRILEIADNKNLYIVQGTAVYNLNNGGQLRGEITFMSNVPMGSAYLGYFGSEGRALIKMSNLSIAFFGAVKGDDYDFGYNADGSKGWLPYYNDVVRPDFGGMENVTKYFVPVMEENYTDSDNDGLYDVLEEQGMMLSNGKIIKTDPLNKDTDGDRLSDGEEMGKYNAERGYYPCYSNPLDRDTDDDGYEDYRDLHPRKVARYSDIFGPVDSLEHLSKGSYKREKREESDMCYGKGVYDINELIEIQSYAASAVVFLYGGIFYNENSHPLIVPDAAANLNHFLMNTGEDFEIDVNSFINSSTYASEKYKEHRKKLAEHVEDVLKDGDTLCIGVKGEKELVAFSKTTAGMVLDVNWTAAFGECNACLTGKYTRKGGYYSGYSVYTIYDFYDWEPNGGRFSIMFPSDGDLFKLHHAGWARHFYLSGNFSEMHSWLS